MSGICAHRIVPYPTEHPLTRSRFASAALSLADGGEGKGEGEKPWRTDFTPELTFL